jgi:hypothetical protein
LHLTLTAGAFAEREIAARRPRDGTFSIERLLAFNLYAIVYGYALGWIVFDIVPAHTPSFTWWRVVNFRLIRVLPGLIHWSAPNVGPPTLDLAIPDVSRQDVVALVSAHSRSPRR